MPLLDERAETAPRDPGRSGAFQIPAAQGFEKQAGMPVADVVEVVGDGFPDVEARIVPQGLEDGQGGTRVGDQLRDSGGPRKPRAAALAGEAADVLVAVPRPGPHRCEGPGEVAFEELAHREFGRTEAG